MAQLLARHEIIGGPIKDELSKSLFEGNPKERHTVTFQVDPPLTQADNNEANVAITLVGQEDGSGESWIFEGYIPSYGSVRGYYSSRDRRGFLNPAR